MNDKPYVFSNANIIKRVPISQDAPYGYIATDVVSLDRPVFVVFGGDLTYTERSANYYAKQIDYLLKTHNISDIDIYSIAYEFGSIDSKIERTEQFRLAGHRVKDIKMTPAGKQRYDSILHAMLENEPIPYYVKHLYNIFIQPRILDQNGERIDANKAIDNIRKIKFYAHCQGAATILQIANYMYDEMIKIGYTKQEIEKIQKEMLVIQHSPLAPLNKQKFFTISFSSATDNLMLDHENLFVKWLHKNASDNTISPLYFDESHGNIFIAQRLYEIPFQEHDNKCISPTEEVVCPLTNDGKIIFGAERNAVVRAAQGAINGTSTTSVKKLTDGNGVDFDQLKQNGDRYYRVMLHDLRQQNLKPDYQK